MRPTFLQINLNALRHNLKRVRTLAPHSKIMAMMKANAYGHSLVETARALADVDAIGVACLAEAAILRDGGIKQPIVLIEGFFYQQELPDICDYNLDIVVHQELQLEALERIQLARPLRAWIKINTGLNRLGFLPAEVRNVHQRLLACPNIKGEPRLLSHFSDPDALTKPVTMHQLECFNKSIEGLAGARSLANSAAILSWPESYFEWVRPGIMLYGISPFSNKTGAEHDLRPVMTLRSEIIAIQPLRKGDAVGYGGTWVSPTEGQLGVVAIGYGDGYPRHASNGTPVLVNGREVALIGRVSMDMLMVDLTSQPYAKVGDPVTLWGEGLPLEKIAQRAETISYELLCEVTLRVRREFVEH